MAEYNIFILKQELVPAVMAVREYLTNLAEHLFIPNINHDIPPHLGLSDCYLPYTVDASLSLLYVQSAKTKQSV